MASAASGEGAPATSIQMGVLNGAPSADPAVTFLYPYDQTVFPQGILAPLFQWTTDPATPFDSVYIHVTESFFEYKGYFQVQAGVPSFRNHPLPQAAWNALAYSNGGEPVSVQLVFSQDRAAPGPWSETWKFALKENRDGTIYYNSYGTVTCPPALGPNPYFGGATLAIKEGATDPVLVAGNTTADPASDHTGCRVCHSVSAHGSTLITQHGDDYGTSSSYALTASNAETVPANNNGGGVLAWPGLYPTGRLHRQLG